MANLNKRIQKLESKLNKHLPYQYTITKLIVEPDGTISGAIQRLVSGEWINVSSSDLVAHNTDNDRKINH